MADVVVTDQGTVVVLRPVSPRGNDWIFENADFERWQWDEEREEVAVDPRCARELVEAMEGDGLEVETR